jgi:PAS domain-containing protein
LQRMGRLLGESDHARQTERNEELATILSLSPDGLVSFDDAGRVTETNPSSLAPTGWAQPDLIGGSRADFWARFSQLGPIAEPEPGIASILRLLLPRSGLGMTIVKEILDIHGGRVEIASQPGHGTSVILWLPWAAPRG